MIVYFFKKSKRELSKWGIAVVMTLVVLYLLYVWSNILKNEHKTLQIVRIETSNMANFEKERPSNQAGGDPGEYAFVASKKGKYYYPINCSKAKSLSVKNMLYFKDKMAAEHAGFTAHTGC